MILSFGSAMMLLLSLCAALLALSVAEKAFRIFRRWHISGEEERYELEKEFYLAYVIVGIVLGIRLFAIPLYFWTMQSFVPTIPGAMCLWGVFNALPELCWSALALKFLLPTLYIGWLILVRINDSCKRNPIIRNLMGFYLAILPLLLLESLMDFTIFYNLNPIRVSCCASAIDEWPRPIPALVTGIPGQIFLLTLFLTLSSLFMILTISSIRWQRLEWPTRLLSLILIPLGILSLTEVLTPWILHLPMHHCPFCLLYKVPAASLLLVLLWISLSSPWWTLTTEKMGRVDIESKNAESSIRQTISGFSGASMLTGLVITGILVMLSSI